MARTDRSLRRGGTDWQPKWAEPTQWHRGTQWWRWMYVSAEILEGPMKGYCTVSTQSAKRAAKRSMAKWVRRQARKEIALCDQ